MNKQFWEILDIPMKYAKSPYTSVIRNVDCMNRVVIPPEATKFYKDKCRVTANTLDGTVVITPIK